MKDLTTGNEGRLIFNFALPLLLSSLFQQLYSFVDSIIVGHYLGFEALTAIGNAMPIIFGLISLVIGVGIGGTIVISQYFGAKDEQNLRKAIDTLFVFLFFAAIIITVAGLLLAKPILNLVNIPPGSEKMALTYLTVFLSGTIMFFGYNGVSAVLRGLGDSKTPLYFMILSTFLNIGLDILFIVALKMGVAGAALASVIAQGTAFLIAVVYLNINHKVIRIRLTGWQFDWEIFKKSMRISLPTGLQQTFVAIGMWALYSVVNRFAEPVPSAYTAAGRVNMMAMLPAMAFAQALSTFTGQNIGAGKINRISKGLKVTILISSVGCIFITVLILLSGKQILGLFSPQESRHNLEFIKTGWEYLIIVSSFYLAFNIMLIFTSIMRGAGDTIIPMFITLIALWGIRVPLAFILSNTQLQETGIWWAIPSGWTFGMILSIIYYFTGRWKTKSVTKPSKPG